MMSATSLRGRKGHGNKALWPRRLFLIWRSEPVESQHPNLRTGRHGPSVPSFPYFELTRSTANAVSADDLALIALAVDHQLVQVIRKIREPLRDVCPRT